MWVYIMCVHVYRHIYVCTDACIVSVCVCAHVCMNIEVEDHLPQDRRHNGDSRSCEQKHEKVVTPHQGLASGRLVLTAQLCHSTASSGKSHLNSVFYF